MIPRSPMPPPIFTKAERAAIDAERGALLAAFLGAGMRPRRDGFPFRQYRAASIRAISRPGPKDAWLRNAEHAGLLLEFSRQQGDPRLYVRIPYAALARDLVASGDLDEERLPGECRAALDAARGSAAEFVAFGRSKLLAALRELSVAG